MMIDKKTFWTGVMTIVAAVLLAAHAMQPTTMMPIANAQEVADHRDWAMATAETASGGEILYILDKRTGQLSVMAWNQQSRTPELKAWQSLPAALNR